MLPYVSNKKKFKNIILLGLKVENFTLDVDFVAV